MDELFAELESIAMTVYWNGMDCEVLAATAHWLFALTPDGTLLAQVGKDAELAPFPAEHLVNALRLLDQGFRLEIRARVGGDDGVGLVGGQADCPSTGDRAVIDHHDVIGGETVQRGVHERRQGGGVQDRDVNGRIQCQFRQHEFERRVHLVVHVGDQGVTAHLLGDTVLGHEDTECRAVSVGHLDVAHGLDPKARQDTRPC